MREFMMMRSRRFLRSQFLNIGYIMILFYILFSQYGIARIPSEPTFLRPLAIALFLTAAFALFLLGEDSSMQNCFSISLEIEAHHQTPDQPSELTGRNREGKHQESSSNPGCPSVR
jgi:hypothetical protein